MTAIKSFFKTILYQPLYNALIFFVWLIPSHNVGLAIIILTVIIRLLLVPSSAKAIESQKQLKELQPELDRIKEKYKGNKQAEAQAMMSFYQANKINPLSSCLPLLIQLPILIILYYVFRDGLDTSRFNLLYSFMPRPETINTMFLGMNLSNPNIYLAVITGLLQFWQTKQMMPKKGQTKPDKGTDTAQKFQSVLNSQMLYIMPIFTVFIGLKLPSALVLYWATTTLFAVGQQYWILKQGKIKKVQVSIRRGGHE